MTTWKQFEQDMMDYLDDLLPADKKKEIDKRLRNDPEALEFCESLKTLKAHLGRLEPVRTSPDFDTVLRTRIRMEKSLSRRSLISGDSRVPVFALASAFAILALALTINFSNSSSSGPFSDGASLSSSVAGGFSGSQQDSGRIQNVTERVNYPMEMVRLPRGGTRLDSDARRRVSTLTDSSKTSREEQMVTVEF